MAEGISPDDPAVSRLGTPDTREGGDRHPSGSLNHQLEILIHSHLIESELLETNPAAIIYTVEVQSIPNALNEAVPTLKSLSVDEPPDTAVPVDVPFAVRIAALRARGCNPVAPDTVLCMTVIGVGDETLFAVFA